MMSRWRHGCNYNGIAQHLKMSCFDWVTMSYVVYMVNCNFVIHATCLLTLMMYKYNELQMSFITQKLGCKASCKTPFFFIVPPLM